MRQSKYNGSGFLKISIAVFLIVASIFLIVSIVNINSTNTLKQEEKKLQNQITTSGTNEPSKKSKSSKKQKSKSNNELANNEIVKKYKSSINNLTSEINKNKDENPIIVTIKEIIESITKALNFDYNEGEKTSDVVSKLKPFFTSKGLNTFVNKFLVKSEDNHRYISQYKTGSIMYSDLDSASPKAIERTTFTDEFTNTIKYLEFEFICDKNTNKYYVSNLDVI